MKLACRLSHLSRVLVTVTMAWCFCWPAQADTRSFAARAVASGDTHGLVFAVIDKSAATLSLYDVSGKLLAASPVLVGRAIADVSVPGIGERAIEHIAPHERTTPAGRFASEPGVNLSGEKIVWIDYEAAVSMHSLRPSNSLEKRPERLATVTPLDNRITYGCVNVPAAFYARWIRPTLGEQRGVIYILPETRPAKEWFAFLR